MNYLYSQIILFPYPYKTFAVIVSIVILLIIGIPAYWIYRSIIPNISEKNRAVIYKILKVVGICIIVTFSAELTGTMITQNQVNKKLGFNYATPETSEGEFFVVTRITSFGVMDKAGLRPDDQMLMEGPLVLYKLLIDNQGKEVAFNVLRDSKEITISVNVPEMHLPLGKFSFYF